MDNFLKNKEEIRKKYESVISERKKNYPSPFWMILEAKKEMIFDDKTSLDESIKILMEIILVLILIRICLLKILKNQVLNILWRIIILK